MLMVSFIKTNRLFKKGDDGNLLLVFPQGLKWRVKKSVHNNVGHPALQSTLKRLFKYFPVTRKFIKNYFKICIVCCFFKDQGRKELIILY